MKTLKNHVIVYDSECPLCKVYTGAFVKTGMLDEEGREAYCSLPQQYEAMVDKDRARNEIALIDVESGKAYYGYESLFKVIENSFPIFKPLFQLTVFRWVILRLYRFISYNRKVIIPPSVMDAPRSCTPDFNLVYRWAYIIFAWLMTSVILTAYSGLLVDYIGNTSLGREFLICAGQIVFQGLVLIITKSRGKVNYLGNMMTISLAGSLLLLPVIFIYRISLNQEPIIALIWFGLVVLLMFLEHIRRLKILKVTYLLTITWVVYRMLVLLIVLSDW